MSRAPRLSAHGLSIQLPMGWDGEIFRRETAEEGATTNPVLHASNFALPRTRGDYGGGAVTSMGSRGVLLCVIEFDTAAAGTALFDRPFPKTLRTRDFAPNQLQRLIQGQAGLQVFATEGGRAFCIYAVLGSYRMRDTLVPLVNSALSTIEITPR